jgi:hypothetical protein
VGWCVRSGTGCHSVQDIATAGHERIAVYVPLSMPLHTQLSAGACPSIRSMQAVAAWLQDMDHPQHAGVLHSTAWRRDGAGPHPRAGR